MIEIIRYNSDLKKEWDNLVSNSRNGTFLFYRDYMDYHAERFIDCSFLVLRKGKFTGLIPGNIDNKSFHSHQGLTYGGLVTNTKIKSTEIAEVFNLINNELGKLGIIEVIYKPVPLIYHRIPSQEDIYLLFLNNAKKIGCHISSTIYQNSKIGFVESRKSGIRKSIREGIKISDSVDLNSFWMILNENLKTKFGIKPVHSLSEIELLISRFPKNIKLYVAEYKDRIVAGTILFLMKNIVHVQYISANEKGKEKGALDFLFDQLINKIYANIPVFDFGQSTERMGQVLNEDLIFQKEGFGGRGVVYEIYKYELNNEDS